MFSFHEVYCHSMEYLLSVKISSFDKKGMSRDFRRHGHQAFMAWSQSFLFINMATVSDSSWEDFFLGLLNIYTQNKQGQKSQEYQSKKQLEE